MNQTQAAIARAYQLIAAPIPRTRAPSNHTAPERAAPSGDGMWNGKGNKRPVEVRYVNETPGRFADGGSVDDRPALMRGFGAPLPAPVDDEKTAIMARALANLEARRPRTLTDVERSPASALPSAADALRPTLGYVAPVSQAAAGYKPDRFANPVSGYAASDEIPAEQWNDAEAAAAPRKTGSGMFDDLIPGNTASAAPAGSGMFDDLIPADPLATPDTDAPPLTWLQYAEGLAQKAAQGATFGFGDELAGAVGAGTNWAARKAGMNVPERTYEEIRDEVRGREKEFETAQPKTALAAEIAGAIGLPIGSGIRATRALARAGVRPGFGRSALAAGATAAPIGAVTAVGKSEGDKSIGDLGEEAFEGAGVAGALGLGFGAAGHGLARFVGPWASDAARRLSDQGIRLTPGQLIGPNAKRIEDALTSMPLVNMLVRGRRNEAIEDMNRVAINRALAPIQRELAPGIEMGHDAVAAAGDEISGAYNRAVPRMQGLRDQILDNQLAHIATTLPQSQRATYVQFVADELNNVTNHTSGNVPISGRDMQHLIGTFRDEANRLMTNTNATHHDRRLGIAFGHAAHEMEVNLLAHSPRAAVAEFEAANEAFANLVRVEKAAGMSDEGIFTPQQLKNAVRMSDTSARKRRVARGEALMQDLSSDSKAVIGNIMADSGTPERTMTAGMILGGGALTLNPSILAAPLALAPFYTRTGRRAFQELATRGANPRQRAREYLERITRSAAPALGVAATAGN